MGYIAKLIYGSFEFNLNDANFTLGEGFGLPAAEYSLNKGIGTSANETGGVVVGKRALDRDWSFGVRIMGNSNAATHNAANRLQAFLNLAYDRRDTLYFAFKPSDSYSYEPIWGQYGAYYRVEIKSATLTIDSGFYGTHEIRERALMGTVACVIGPYTLGKRQQVCSAVGGVIEDTIGTLNGESRGLFVPIGSSNKMTNPAFSHATWNNGWTAAAGIVAEQNTDMAYLLFGTSSAKITRTGAGTSYTQSINVGNTNTHMLSFFAKKEDGSEVVAQTDCRLFYNSGGVNATALPIANGWYRLYATVTGVNASVTTGMEIYAGKSLYVDGFMIEEISALTPFCYGDMLGCAWSGTVAETSTTRTASRVRLPLTEVINRGSGTVRIALRMGVPNTYGSSLTFWDCFDGTYNTFRGGFNPTGDLLEFTDGTNTASSSAQTFAVGDLVVLHYTWGADGLRIYRDGVSCATADFTQAETFGSYCYIGSNYTAGAQDNASHLGVAFFDREMTSTEVSNDYTDINAWVASGDGEGRRLDAIPWLWTQDGDDQLDNCDDSTYDNWGVIGGVIGDVDADTEWRITPGTAKLGYYLMQAVMPVYDFIKPTSQWYQEMQGTALATCSGGEYLAISSFPHTPTAFGAVKPWLYQDSRVHYFCRIASATADTVTVRPAIRASATWIYGDAVTISTDSTFIWKYLGSLTWGNLKDISILWQELDFGIEVDRAGADNVWLDFVMAISGKVLYIPVGAFISSYLHIHGAFVNQLTQTSNLLVDFLTGFGDRIEIIPQKLNMIWFVSAGDTQAHTITNTATFTSVHVTPRYTIL